MLPHSAKIRGFTLVELIVTLAILAIFATLAAPSVSGFFDKRRAIEAAEDLYSRLQLARIEAISRSKDITFQASFSTGLWRYGYTESSSGCDPAISTMPTINSGDTLSSIGNPCITIIPDGDSTLQAITNSTSVITDSDDLALNQFDNNDYTDVTLTATANSITFNPQRGTVTPSTNFTIKSAANDTLVVKVGTAGQIRLCSPATATGIRHVSGYSDDNCP